MTKLRSIVFALFLAAGGWPCPGAEMTQFEWWRPIEGAPGQGQLFRLEIPADVYARSQDFPRDVRIFDAGDRTWPFYLATTPPRIAAKSLETESVNSAWVEGVDPYLRIDIHVKKSASDPARPRHNQAILSATGREFIRRVEVFGSEDQEAWALLGKGYLIQVSQPRHIVEDSVHYALSDYPFVQVRVYPNARNAMETFTLNRVELRTQQEVDQPERVAPHQTLTPAKADRNPDAQVLVLNLQYEKLPVETLRLSSGEGGDYLRRAVVWLRDEPSEPWRFAGAGDVHRIGSSVKDRVPLRGSGRLIKVELYHYDDPPLKFDVLEILSPRRYLVVESVGANDPKLHYGAEGVEPARYDLSARHESMDMPEAPLVSLGEPQPNPYFKKKRLRKVGPHSRRRSHWSDQSDRTFGHYPDVQENRRGGTDL